jgi:hypothetical protein
MKKTNRKPKNVAQNTAALGFLISHHSSTNEKNEEEDK